MKRRVPRLHRWLLDRVAPAAERAELVADLDDEMQRRAARDGDGAARRWYRRQVRRSIGPIVLRRLSLRFGGVGAAPHRPAAGPATGALHDLRLALRTLAASPVFALSTMLMVSLGVGAFTVVYAFVDAQAVRALPFGDRNDRLVTVHSVHPSLTDFGDLEEATMSYADFVDVREASTSFEALEAVIDRSVAVSAGDQTQRLLAASVTPGMFRMLGVAPVLGRSFTDEDAAELGFEAVALVSHALWRDLIGGDGRFTERTIRLNGRAVAVVGVMPPGFAFPEEHQLWLPYGTNPTATSRQNRSWLVVGLLRPGISSDEGLAEVRALAARLAERHPDTNQDWSALFLPIRSLFVGSLSDEGTMLAAVSLLLLAACANIAGLIVARGMARRGELTLRAALGARRGRLVRWLAAEAVVVAACGGGLGLLFGHWGIDAMTAWIPERPAYWALPRLDLRVALVALGVTSGVALLAGVVPALRLSRTGAASGPAGLVTGARAVGHGAHRRLQQLLVVGQVGLGFALVVGALLLGRSATALLTADAGFDHRPLLSGRFYIAGDRYDPIESKAGLVDDVVARVSALPGVRSAAATGAIPSDDGGDDLELVPPEGGVRASEAIGAQLVPVTPSFWRTLRLQLLDGRTFTASEAADPSTDAVIVNRRLAERFWPADTAVGQTLGVWSDGEILTRRVVGVAPDLVYEELSEATPQSQLNVYVPYASAGWRTQALLVDVASGDPGALADMLRREIREIDPGLAVYDVMTMRERRQYNHWVDQFLGRAMSVFAVAALVLACVGAYGVSAQSVAERRREIGLRMAVGATAGDIRGLFLRTGARLALAGTAVGLPLALGTARAIEGTLFQVSPWQAWIWVGLPVLLGTTVILATYWPARGASRIDPSVTLRDG